MSANQSMRIKKDDLVKVVAGSHKGKLGKVLRTEPAKNLVFIEKLGVIKRHVKPSQLNPRGGTKELHRGIDASKVALVVDEAKGTTSRVSYKVAKDGNKVRVATRTKKEIK